MTPYERTTKVLRFKGLVRGIGYDKGEKWFPPSKKYPRGHNEDLFSIIDLVVLDNGIVGIQCCGGSGDYMKHIRKLRDEKRVNTMQWLKNGGKLQIWAWRKLKKVRGKKATHWVPRIADFYLEAGEIYVKERK
jgi:hypothetical protein